MPNITEKYRTVHRWDGSKYKTVEFSTLRNGDIFTLNGGWEDGLTPYQAKGDAYAAATDEFPHNWGIECDAADWDRMEPAPGWLHGTPEPKDDPDTFIDGLEATSCQPAPIGDPHAPSI